MDNQLCVSSYSVRQLLGPIQVTVRGPNGTKTPFTWGAGTAGDPWENTRRTRDLVVKAFASRQARS
jgi:hypothetical protein